MKNFKTLFWVSLAVGALLLLAGIIVKLSANFSLDQLKAQSGAALDQGTQGTGAIIGGGVLLALLCGMYFVLKFWRRGKG